MVPVDNPVQVAKGEEVEVNVLVVELVAEEEEEQPLEEEEQVPITWTSPAAKETCL